MSRIITNYNSYNENLLDKLSSKVSNSFKGIFSKSENLSLLKKYHIESKKISDTHFKFINKNRIIAELKIDGEEYNKPIFILSIYYYDSEIENKDNLSLKKKFEGQEEQPYGKGSKRFFTTDNAIKFLTEFWSLKTNSGRSKNKDYKIKL